jgi:hypothetical protein
LAALLVKEPSGARSGRKDDEFFASARSDQSREKSSTLRLDGKGMFIFLVPGSVFKVNRAPLLGIYPEGTEIKYHAHVDMKTASGEVVPWLCSQTDMLAEDWEIVSDDVTVIVK